MLVLALGNALCRSFSNITLRTIPSPSCGLKRTERTSNTQCVRCSDAESDTHSRIRDTDMENPFLRRATEFLRDDEAFLAIVSPEPVTFFLKKSGESGRLYDRLVLLRGTPGSGKTTLARLFEYSTLAALLRNSSVSTYQALVGA